MHTPDTSAWRLFLFLLSITALILLLSGLGLLPPYATGTPTTERRCQCEVDVFLAVEADDEGGDVDDLFADAVELPLAFVPFHICFNVP